MSLFIYASLLLALGRIFFLFPTFGRAGSISTTGVGGGGNS